jgi:Zn-dependent protease
VLGLDPYLIILTIPALVIGFTFHEFAHAWVATYFGDDTPLRQGRVTLNPLVHLDPMGTILLLVAGFGWAKPVQVNTAALQPRVLGDIMVSLAGVIMNFLVAIIFTVLTAISNAGFFTGYYNETVTDMLWRVVVINVLLCVFNLIPLPPLDGFHVARYLFPRSMEHIVSTLYRMGPILLILLFISGYGWRFLQPAMGFMISLITLVVSPILRLLSI